MWVSGHPRAACMYICTAPPAGFGKLCPMVGGKRARNLANAKSCGLLSALHVPACWCIGCLG